MSYVSNRDVTIARSSSPNKITMSLVVRTADSDTCTDKEVSACQMMFPTLPHSRCVDLYISIAKRSLRDINNSVILIIFEIR